MIDIDTDKAAFIAAKIAAHPTFLPPLSGGMQPTPVTIGELADTCTITKQGLAKIASFPADTPGHWCGMDRVDFVHGDEMIVVRITRTTAFDWTHAHPRRASGYSGVARSDIARSASVRKFTR